MKSDLSFEGRMEGKLCRQRVSVHYTHTGISQPLEISLGLRCFQYILEHTVMITVLPDAKVISGRWHEDVGKQVI